MHERRSGTLAEGRAGRCCARSTLRSTRFIAAEAATLGGAFLWTRKPSWRPRYCVVDGEQVDYAWIDDSDSGKFDAETLAEIRASHQTAEE